LLMSGDCKFVVSVNRIEKRKDRLTEKLVFIGPSFNFDILLDDIWNIIFMTFCCITESGHLSFGQLIVLKSVCKSWMKRLERVIQYRKRFFSTANHVGVINLISFPNSYHVYQDKNPKIALAVTRRLNNYISKLKINFSSQLHPPSNITGLEIFIMEEYDSMRKKFQKLIYQFLIFRHLLNLFQLFIM